MLSNDERPSSDRSIVGDQCFAPIEIQPSSVDQFGLAFALDLRFDDQDAIEVPQGPTQRLLSPLSDAGQQRYSIAALVSLLSVSIRTNAFARCISLRSLQVEAALGHEQLINRSGTIKVTVTLDAYAPRPAVEALLAHVARWEPGPALTGLPNPVEISLLGSAVSADPNTIPLDHPIIRREAARGDHGRPGKL
jgi:hypothetical protein